MLSMHYAINNLVVQWSDEPQKCGKNIWARYITGGCFHWVIGTTNLTFLVVP